MHRFELSLYFLCIKGYLSCFYDRFFLHFYFSFSLSSFNYITAFQLYQLILIVRFFHIIAGTQFHSFLHLSISQIKFNKFQSDKSKINIAHFQIKKYHLPDNIDMNRSDRKLKTIQSEQPKRNVTYEANPSEFRKEKKESSKKISLKQAGLKQAKDLSMQQMIARPKKSHQVSIENDHRYKIVKQLENLSKPQQIPRKQQKPTNLSKNNKSLIFSQHKLTNPHNSSTLKASKIFTSDNKHPSTLTKEKQQIYNYKKGSHKVSTTKKHSKSVYNYTEFDQYPETRQERKKQQRKENQSQKSRQIHNKSNLTHQGHQASTSSITKRASKSKQLLNRLLNNSEIRKKTSHFKILSNCLRTYLRDEQLSDNKIDAGQIIKLVKAFNKAQISQMSKPLEELIQEIVGLIQETVNKQKQQTAPHHQKHVHTYQTPQRASKRQQRAFPSSSQRKSGEFNVRESSGINPSDISKTKKFMNDNHEIPDRVQQKIVSDIQQSSLSKDLIKMERGLEQLKSEEKQLKKVIHESSNKKTMQQQVSQSEQNQKKKIQIHRLRQILQKQKFLLQKIENYQESQSEKSSEDSSLKYYPNQ